jgi:isopenicillin-N N-acyltransferase-like protein
MQMSPMVLDLRSFLPEKLLFLSEKLLWITLFGEATKGTCTMFGAWGEALKNVPDVNLLQLRALDWDNSGKKLQMHYTQLCSRFIQGPFPKWPAVVVYHPSNNNGHAFANVGWVGWVGSITGKHLNHKIIYIAPSSSLLGMSSEQMAISEIGVYFPDATWGTESRFGYPFTVWCFFPPHLSFESSFFFFFFSFPNNSMC